jgi:predicted nucleotidyltransferase
MKSKKYLQQNKSLADSVNEPELEDYTLNEKKSFFSINLEELNKICHTHLVDKLYVFGSAVTDKFNMKSDIDFLVRFKEIDLVNYFENFLSLKSALEILYKRKVDLLEEQTLKNPVLIRTVNKSKKLIYG